MAFKPLRKTLENIISNNQSNNLKKLSGILAGDFSHLYKDRQVEFYNALKDMDLTSEDLTVAHSLNNEFKKHNESRMGLRTDKYNNIIVSQSSTIDNALEIHALLKERLALDKYKTTLFEGIQTNGRNYGQLMRNVASTSSGLEEMINAFEPEKTWKSSLQSKYAKATRAIGGKIASIKDSVKTYVQSRKKNPKYLIQDAKIAGGATLTAGMAIALGLNNPFVPNRPVYGQPLPLPSGQYRSIDDNLKEMLQKNGIRTENDQFFLTSEDVGIIGDLSGYSFVAKYVLHVLEPKKRYTQDEYYKFGLELAGDNGVFKNFKNRPQASEKIDVTEFIQRHYIEPKKPEVSVPDLSEKPLDTPKEEPILEETPPYILQDKPFSRKFLTKPSKLRYEKEKNWQTGFPIPTQSIGGALKYTLNSDNLFTKEALSANLLLYIAGTKLVSSDSKIVGQTYAHHLNLALPYLLIGAHKVAAEKGLVKEIPSEYYSFAKVAAFVFYDDLYQHFAQHFGWHPELDRNGNYVDFSLVHEIDQQMNFVGTDEDLMHIRYYLASLPIWKFDKKNEFGLDKRILKEIMLEVSAEEGQGWGVGLNARIADEPNMLGGIFEDDRFTWDFGVRGNVGYAPNNGINSTIQSTDYTTTLGYNLFNFKRIDEPQILKDLFFSFGLAYRDYHEPKYKDDMKIELGVGLRNLPF